MGCLFSVFSSYPGDFFSSIICFFFLFFLQFFYKKVDLSQLPVSTLRRYKRHYRIPTRPGMSKSQLIDVRDF